MTVKTPRSFALALALALQTSTCSLPDPVLAVVATVTSWPEDAQEGPLFEAGGVAPIGDHQADAGPAGRLAGGPAGLGPFSTLQVRVPRHPGPWLDTGLKTS